MADRILSQDSGIAPFETLFHDFDFEAMPFFNYWTSDELTNDRMLKPDTNTIDDMPRYIKLAWNLAPDLVEQKTAADKLNPSNNIYRNSTFAQNSDPADAIIVDGVKYSPDQLRPKTFVQIINALGNSDIAPGIVSSVVSFPLQNSNLAVQPAKYTVDLDSWYSSPASDGVPLNFLQSVLLNRTSGYYALPHLIGADISPNVLNAHYEMFSGRYSVSYASFINPRTIIGAANPMYPSIGLRTYTAGSTRPQPFPTPVQTIFNQTTVRPSVAPEMNFNSIKVAFVDVAVGAVVSQERVNAVDDAAHANSIAAMAQMLGSLIAYSEAGLQNSQRKISVKSFDAPVGLSGRQYVGYIIEKYEQIDGAFKLREVIGIGDPLQDDYYDTRVKYGSVYRYRIRSIIRWVRPRSVGPTGTDRTVYDLLSTQTSATSQTTLTPNFATYFGSEWSKNWATAYVIDTSAALPPDQLQLRPDSRRKRIVVNFQLPENNQRDIAKMTLYRRVIDDNGMDVQPWTSMAEFGMNRPGYFVDTNVDFIPSVPSAAQLGFTPIAPYRYIYAVSSTSVHNGESLPSEQLGARLNSNFDNDGEFPVEFYSSRGIDRLRDTGIFSTIPIRKYKTHIVVKPKNAVTNRHAGQIVLTGQERIARRLINGSSYILRVHSLDTGETVDVPFSTQIDQVPARYVQAPTNIYVPSTNEEYFYDSQALVSR